MNKTLRNRLLVIAGVILAAVYFTFPIQKHINFGLDLKGGMHLIVQVETEKLESNAKKDAVDKAIEILRKRIDSLGAGEIVIQRQGENQILIQLPGITDRETAKKLIGTVAKLNFHLVNDNPTQLAAALEGKVPEGYLLKQMKREDGASPILIEEKIALNGEVIADAMVDFGNTGDPQISLKFNSEGSKQFGMLTQNNVNRALAIVLDNEVLSAPNINEPILGGNAQITGRFSPEEAALLALALRSGALPADMHIEEERTIGPLLGKDSIQAGINAAVLGASLLFTFMLVYYLKAGLVANIALLINLLLVFGSMGFLNAMLPASPMTLTLPGIAGIILTLGMAVDANVLINERIREEIENRQPIQTAINNGFNRAFSAIFDSNLTTLMAAFMLFQFGSGPIKGFAVTLSMGLVCSLFTALYVSKTLFSLFYSWGWLKTLPMMKFFSNPRFDYISKRYICYTISLIVIGASIYALVQKKSNAYGIDFVGGQIQEFRFSNPINADEVRDALKKVGMEDAIIQQFEQFPSNVIVRTSAQEDRSAKIEQTFKENFPNYTFEVLRVEKVGPVVGAALQKAAMLAMIFALVGILIYVGFRFKHFDFAAAGVIALLHDVFITLGVLVMLDRQIDLLVITALLTIAGYSINDTIVIYDRVRENMGKVGKEGLAKIINLSVNQTLSRTILTTSATMIVVLALFLRGGEVLNTFALALIIGFISGTYSTVFIASPLVLAWHKKSKG